MAGAQVTPNIGQTIKAAIQAEIDQNPSIQQSKAAKEGIKALTTALPDVVQGIKSAVEKQLNDQKQEIKQIVDNRLAAAGLSTAPAAATPSSGGARRRRSRGKKISAKGINKMASRRGTRRSTRRRAGSRKARKASRKAARK